MKTTSDTSSVSSDALASTAFGRTGGRTLRADAERNRLMILDAATEALTVCGLDVSVEEIARRAGVGSATIYRRFRTRDELLLAALQERSRAYADLVDEALEIEDVWAAFTGLIWASCERQAADAGFRDVVSATHWPDPNVGEHTKRAADGWAVIIERAKAAGMLRADFEPADVRVFLMANAGIVKASDDPELWRRHIGYLIDAFRKRDGPQASSPVRNEAGAG